MHYGTKAEAWHSNIESAKIIAKEVLRNANASDDDAPRFDARTDAHGQPRGLRPDGQPVSDSLRGRRARPGAALPRGRRPGSRPLAGAVAPAAGGGGRPRLPRLWAAARGPDPGRQHRLDEGREALRPGARRAPGVVRDPLDQGREPRVHPAQLAHGP